MKDRLHITAKDEKNMEIKPLIENCWYSGYYGVKESSLRLTFITETNAFKTLIKFK